ncbi:MAG: PAS domain S-box protein, partial [Bellilinea sp.]
ALIRKLEDKVAELQEKNRKAETENEARKKAEEELQESKNSYAALVDNAPVGVYRTQDGVFLFVNQELASMANYASPADLIGQQSLLLYQDSCDRTRMLEALSKERQIKNFETRLLTRDGKTKVVLLSATAEDGLLTGMVIDITDRKQIEEKLRESEELFKYAFENAPIGKALVAPDGRFLKINRSLVNILGYSEEELLKKTYQEITHPDDQDIQLSYTQQLLAGEIQNYQIEKRYFHKNGQIISAQVNMSLARDKNEKPLYLVSQYQDITLSQRMEEELRHSNDLLNITGEIAKIGGWEIHLETQTLSWTKEVYRIHEVDPATKPNVAEAIHFYAPEDRPVITAAVQDCIASGKPYDLELQLITAKGKRIWVRAQGAAERSDGKITRIYGAFQDITERKLAEEKLRQSEERYRLISTVASDYMFSSQIGADGKLSLNWVAGAFEEIAGYSFEEFVARGGWRATLHPDDLAADDRDMERLRAGQSINSELRTITKSGKTVWVSIYAHPVLDAKTNRLISIYGAVQDITARKQAEELIQQRTQDLELINAISSAINQGMEIKDIITFVSKELLDIFHCDVVVVAQPGPYQNFLLVEHVEFTSTLFKKVEKMIGGNRKSLNVKMPITGDGQYARILKQGEIEMINDPETIRAMMAEYGENEIQRRLISQASKVLGFRCVIPVPLVTNDGIYGLLQIGHNAPLPESSIKRIRVIAAQMTAAFARKHTEQQTIQRLQNIEALHTIDNAIANSMDLQLTLQVVAKETIMQCEVDAVDILLYNPVSNMLETSVNQGFHTPAMQKVSLWIGQGLAGQIASNWQRIFVPDLAVYRGKDTRASTFSGEDFVSYCGLPLWAKGQFIGVLEVFNRSQLNPDLDWFNFIETLAGQAAIAIDSINSFNEIQISNSKLVLAYDATIVGWSRAMDLRDKETEGHTQRVTELTIQLARAVGVGNEEIVHIRRGALLHDMGKLGIPDRILLKPGKLTDEEWVIMRKHPVYAYDMLSSIEYLRPALDIPYCHHEKWDGSGYPRGLKGEEIPLAARIFAVIDAWDALTSDRPYRKAWSREQTLEYIREQTGSHFDPQIVEVFLANMDLR